MKKIKILLISLASIPLLWVTNIYASFFDDTVGNTKIRYCDSGECGINEGIDAIRGKIRGVESSRSLSQYIQDVVIYALWFISLIAVIYIIYNGFLVLTSSGDEEKLKKARQSIVYVIIGIIVMWLAWAITLFIMQLIGA